MSTTNKPYKKRVISESDNDSSDEDAPLSATLGSSSSGSNNTSVPSAGEAKSTSASHAEAVATGSILLHQAGHPDQKSIQPKPELEDAHLRHEIAASGFPVAVTNAISSTGAHANHAKANAAESKVPVDGEESSDDDKPLSATLNGKAKATNGKDALPSFKKDDAKKSTKTDEKKKESKGKSRKDNEDEDMEDSSDEDEPLSAQVAKAGTSKANGKPAKSKKRASTSSSGQNGSESDSEDSEPIAKKNKKAKKADSDFSADEEELPVKKGKKKADGKKAEKNGAAKPPKASTSKKRAKQEDSDSDVPLKSKKTTKAKTEGDVKPAKKRVKKEESVDASDAASSKNKKGKAKAKEEDGEGGEDEEEEFKWWDMEQTDGPKWTTLSHNGVLFPPEYTPLPGNVKLKYDGKPVDLDAEAEEVAGFFGAMLETDHAKNETFQNNFFKDFRDVLSTHPPRNKVKIGKDDFGRLDFRDIYNHYELEREKKKQMTKAEKETVKNEKAELEKPFKTALIDGRKETVGNFRLEPPGLFRGRGEHPKKGALKLRLKASDITINIGKDAKVPEPPEGQEWAKVQHDNTVTWLATWKENINGATKYVFLAANSSWKGQADWKKFEKARKLKDHIDQLRKDYTADLSSQLMAERQRATAVYLIDRFALRVGNEKGDDEADTFGCCSLRHDHITLKEPNLVTFDFLGKDSIRFYQPDKEVDLQIFKNLKIFKKQSSEGDDLFDRVNPTIINKYLGSYMEGLSAKVFRTYNASTVLQQQLANTPTDASVADKILHYNRANRLVAELCNHQRAAPKTHGATMEKLADKVRALKYQRMKLRYALWNVEDGNKKKHKAYQAMESDIDEDWCEKYEKEQVELQKQKARKKWEKDNEKRKADGEAEHDEEDLQQMLDAAEENGREMKEERVQEHVEAKKGQTTAKILDAILKMDARIDAQKIAAVDKEEGKEISLTTSKINYMDPRVTAAWCKKHDVPIEKMFAKTLRTKFVWAMNVEADWEF